MSLTDCFGILLSKEHSDFPHRFSQFKKIQKHDNVLNFESNQYFTLVDLRARIVWCSRACDMKKSYCGITEKG